MTAKVLMEYRSFHLAIGNGDRDGPKQVVQGLHLGKRRVVVGSAEWSIRITRRLATGMGPQRVVTTLMGDRGHVHR
jgi:putative N-acetylmannosamine-6-phosphate epimerase